MSAYSTKFKTTWVVGIVAVALGVWDLYARRFAEGTISEIFLSSAKQSPLLPFLFGVLCGHLFWPQVEDKAK